MVQRTIITLSLLGSLTIIGLASGIFSAVAMFIIIGQLPASDASLSPSTMLALWIGLAAVLALAVFVGSSLPSSIAEELRRQRLDFKRYFERYRQRTYAYRLKHSRLPAAFLFWHR